MAIQLGEIAEAHWRGLQLLLPGRAVGLYLIGSAAVGDFQPTSDIDTITVVDRALDMADQQVLRAVHADLHRDFPAVRYDTTYVLQEWLHRTMDPDTVPPMPFSQDGQLQLGERSAEVHPITWLALARGGVRVAGPEIADLDLHVDLEAARSYALSNLHRYWAALGAELALATRWRNPRMVLDEPAAVVWAVLGSPRLAAFLETGELVSKSEAADYLSRTFPQFASLAWRCAEFRRGQQQVFTIADARTAAEVVREVVDRAAALSLS
jgi:Nucleotidyltransferase domain